jgi:hypothetical protein
MNHSSLTHLFNKTFVRERAMIVFTADDFFDTARILRHDLFSA